MSVEVEEETPWGESPPPGSDADYGKQMRASRAEQLSPPEPVQEPRPLAYGNAEEWVVDWALPHFRRNLHGDFRWAPDWWKYEEAGTVLEALWETFETMRWAGALGMAAYMRDYFYPLMGQLTAKDGPFWAYDHPKMTDVPDTWDTDVAPDGWFHDARTEPEN